MKIKEGNIDDKLYVVEQSDLDFGQDVNRTPNRPKSGLKRTPNTIQQDIHMNIRLAGNSPAGYSVGIILLPITQKIIKKKHYSKNESYLTQWHTKGLTEYHISFPLFKVSEP